jgi:hypothetical protein
MSNTNLNKAKETRNDEFYTQLADIENELKYYTAQFRNKIVLLNCDDPFESNFFKYFASSFNALGLKKLIATSYTPSPVAFTQLSIGDIAGAREIPSSREKKTPLKIEINQVPDSNKDGAVDLSDVKLLLQNDKNVATPLKGNGDFRSTECMEFLKEADIVCTNPPFSLAREYIAQLFEYNKEFLIIGDDNWISLKEVFPLIKNNKMWRGYKKVKEFKQPDGTIKKFGNKGWFTNLDVRKRHEFLDLYRRYTSEKYPKYHNYDAIEVGEVKDIPEDYSGPMGVPITFLDKHNPDQFEIIGISLELAVPMKTLAEKGTYMQGGPRFYVPDGDNKFHRKYDRIVIKRKAVR